MRKLVLLSVILMIAMAQIASAQVNNSKVKSRAPQWETPLINGYGRIKYYPNAAMQPDKSLDYKVVFKITGDNTKDGVNGKLWHMARLMNLLYAGGIESKHVHMVGVIAGGATTIVLNNKTYKERFHKDNPNLDILKKLTEHGAIIYVCDQALAEHKISQQGEVNKYVKKSLSAIVDLPTFILKGYALIP